MQGFFITHITVVYFVYGLAFFTLGLSLSLQSRKDSDFVLAKSLWLLAVFGLIHAFAEWAKVYVSIELRSDVISSNVAFHVIEAIIVTFSFVFLFLFGVNLLIDSIKKYRQLKYVPLALGALWLVKFLVWDLMISGVDAIDQWTLYSTSIARYFLAFPGALTSGVAMSIQAKNLKGFGMHSAAKNCTLAAVVFFCYSFVSGLVVLPVNFWPGNFLNTQTFFDFLGLPVQIFRASLGLLMAYTMIRIINIFDTEQNQRLAKAKQQSILIQERERFSRDLHDGIIQSIYSVGLILECGKLMLKQGDIANLEDKLDDSQQKLNNTIKLLRNYIGNLQQLKKEGHGVKELLENVGQEFKGLSMLDLKVRANFEQEITLTPKQANFLHHILQEALFNVIKHAHASQVVIKACTENTGQQQNLKIIISDDGEGFDLQAVRNRSSAENQGLTNMKFRAQRLQGSLEVITAPSLGTKITLIFPLGGITSEAG